MDTILVLTKVTPSSKGGFINSWKTLNAEPVATPLGTMSTAVHYYCTKSLNQMAVGTQASVDMNNFTVQESDPFVGTDGKEHTTKWLRVK
jgi:hypothetical protein